MLAGKILPFSHLVLMLIGVPAAAQTLGVYQSTYDNRQYELRQSGELNLDIYDRDGKIVATLDRKKASDKFKGQTRMLATKCPDNAGKIEVTTWAIKRIKMRMETPSPTMDNKVGCNVSFLPSWEPFDLIQQSEQGFPAAAASAASAAAAQASSVTAGSTAPSPTPSAAPPTPTVARATPPAGAAKPPSGATNVAAAVQPNANAPVPKEFEELTVQTYLNGSGPFEAGAVTLDEAGNALIGGTCQGIPMIWKLDKAGSYFHFRTSIALPGNAPDFCKYGPTFDPLKQLVSPQATVRSIHTDASGKIYLTGFVREPDKFLTVNAFRPRPVAGTNGQIPQYRAEGFVARLSSDGKTIEYSTLLGGLGEDFIYAAALAPTGELWLTGRTTSADFPRISALGDFKGGDDAFIVMMDSAGKPRFSTAWGSAASEAGTGVQVAQDGHVLVSGVTWTSEFAGTGKDCQRSCGFLLDLDSSRRAVEWVKEITLPDGEGRLTPINLQLGKDQKIHIVSMASNTDHFIPSRQYTPRNDVDQQAYADLRRVLGNATPAIYQRYDRQMTALEQQVLVGSAGLTEAVSMVLAGDGAYIVGTTERTQGVNPDSAWSLRKETDHGRQPFLAKISDGQVTWSRALSGRTEKSGINTWSAYAKWEQPTTVWETPVSVDVRNNEVVLVGGTVSSSMPTTLDSVQPTPAQSVSFRGENVLIGGAYLAKFKIQPTLPACKIWTNPARLFLSNQGGQDFFAFVTTNTTACEWTAQSMDPWMKVQAIEGNMGTLMVKIDVETNVDDKRTGSLVFTAKSGEKYTMPITQSAVPVSVNLTSTTTEIASRRGGVSSIPVDAADGTEWQVSSTAGWIVVETPTGKGKGEVRVRAQANTGNSPRSGYVLIGDRQVTITQGIDDLPEQGGPAPAAPKPAAPKPSTAKPGAAPVPAPAKRIPLPSNNKK